MDNASDLQISRGSGSITAVSAKGAGKVLSIKLPKQERSARTWDTLAAAAIEIIALEGLPALTHRRLAKAAGVSLASTTYYFPKQTDIVSAVSGVVMDGYLDGFNRALARYEAGKNPPATLWEFAIRVVRSSTHRTRHQAMAWAEIYLDGVRHSESRSLVSTWIPELSRAWNRMAQLLEPSLSEDDVQSYVDRVIGLTFAALCLDLSEDQVTDVLVGSDDPKKRWVPGVSSVSCPKPSTEKRRTPKAARTREALVEAAITIITAEGPSALTYSRIAQDVGVALSAPSYHFSSLSEVMQEAQEILFGASKDRYRDATASIYQGAVSLEKLTDVTSFILQREVMSFPQENLALYQIWIEAGRRPDIRGMVWSSILDQANAWDRVLEPLPGHGAQGNGMQAQMLFVGRLIRLLSSGGDVAALAEVRAAFARDLKLQPTP